MQTLSRAVALVLAVSAPAAAEPLEGDVEIDPTAYVLAGNSIHAGLARGHWRLDLGNFGLAVPRALAGDDRFDVSFTGYGAKLQYFARPTRTGWFAGVEAAVSTMHVALRGTDRAGDDTALGYGVQAGYRLALPAHFYATLWLGVGLSAGADDVIVDGNRYEPMQLSIFPALHLGYRFR